MKIGCHKIAFIVTVGWLVFAAESVFAQRFHDPQEPYQTKGGQPKDEFIQKMVEELGLSQEQVQEITKNKKKNQKQSRVLREKIKQIKETINAELLKEKPSEKTLQRLTNELKAAQAEMVDHHIEGILTLKHILTPEQFNQFNETMQGKREKFSRFREKTRNRWTERNK